MSLVATIDRSSKLHNARWITGWMQDAEDGVYMLDTNAANTTLYTETYDVYITLRVL